MLQLACVGLRHVSFAGCVNRVPSGLVPLGPNWTPHTFHWLSAVARLVAWWVLNLTSLVRAMASSDGGFSAPSTAPTFAADSAASANSDSGVVVFAAPAPAQNGTPGRETSGGADNSMIDVNANPFDVVPALPTLGGVGDATDPAEGFAAIEEQVWGPRGEITKETMDAPQSKNPRGAHSAPPLSQIPLVSTRYR